MSWQAFYQSISLTQDEIEAAILEAKIKKYFNEKNKEYWQEQENKSKSTPATVRNRTDKQTKPAEHRDGG